MYYRFRFKNGGQVGMYFSDQNSFANFRDNATFY